MITEELRRIQDEGSCVGKDADIWFEQEHQAAALRVCAQRPVQIECLRYALHLECLRYALHHERFGVWGGTTAEGRRKIRLRRNINLPPLYEGAYRAARTTPRKAEP